MARQCKQYGLQALTASAQVGTLKGAAPHEEGMPDMSCWHLGMWPVLSWLRAQGAVRGLIQFVDGPVMFASDPIWDGPKMPTDP